MSSKQKEDTTVNFEDNEPKKTCWTTTQMADDKEERIRTLCRELMLYILFLILLLIIAFGMLDVTMYYYTKVLRVIFIESTFTLKGEHTSQTVSFKSAAKIDDFWGYVDGPLLDGLFWDYWYESAVTQNQTISEDKNILFENKLLALARIRQVKVKSDSCEVLDNFKRLFPSCYGYFSTSAEDRASFGPGQPTAWTYSSPEKLETDGYRGTVSWYNGGGYYIDLPLDRNSSKSSLQDLKDNLWITRGTRAIFIDFTVYNPNVNIFCVIKLVLEVPPTGGVLPYWHFNTVRLIRYLYPYDFFVLACEITLIVFVVYYTVEEVRELLHFRSRYFTFKWNWVDLCILASAYATIIIALVRFFKVDDNIKELMQITDKYANFDDLVYWQKSFNNSLALFVFLAWIKFFKYISFNKTMIQLSTTLNRCSKDIAGFAVMFFIIFMAFVQMGYLLFGTQVYGFSSIGISIFTLLRAVLGDFDYDAIAEAHSVLGPIYFLFYIFFIFFVLLNMFLAIINETYAQVKNEVGLRSEIGIWEYFCRCWTRFSPCCAPSPEEHARPDDTKLTRDEIRQTLRKHNFTDNEIDMFLAKYDIDEDKIIGDAETQKMLDEMELRKTEAQAQEEEIRRLRNQITKMEKQINEVAGRMDTVVRRL